MFPSSYCTVSDLLCPKDHCINFLTKEWMQQIETIRCVLKDRVIVSRRKILALEDMLFLFPIVTEKSFNYDIQNSRAVTRKTKPSHLHLLAKQLLNCGIPFSHNVGAFALALDKTQLGNFLQAKLWAACQNLLQVRHIMALSHLEIQTVFTTNLKQMIELDYEEKWIWMDFMEKWLFPGQTVFYYLLSMREQGREKTGKQQPSPYFQWSKPVDWSSQLNHCGGKRRQMCQSKCPHYRGEQN